MSRTSCTTVFSRSRLFLADYLGDHRGGGIAQASSAVGAPVVAQGARGGPGADLQKITIGLKFLFA
jgi:hypothetical protein